MLAHDQKLKEAFEELERGKESLRSLASRLGIPKSTLHDWYMRWLGQRIEERRRALKDLEHRVLSLQRELDGLESKYAQKSKLLEEDYQRRKSTLEGKLSVLKKEIANIEAVFEKQGITLTEAIKTIKGVRDLQAERDMLNNEIANLKTEVAGWQDRLNKTKSRLQFLEGDEKDLMAKLATHYLQLDYFRRQLPKLEEREKQLHKSIAMLENDKVRLEAEASWLKGTIAKLQRERAEAEASLKTMEAEREKAKGEIDKLSKELEGFTERMIKDAEGKRAKILREIEILESEKKKLKAERDLLECMIGNMLKQLRQAEESRKKSWPLQTRKGSISPLESLIERLSKLTPINEVDRKTQKASTNSN